MSIWSRMFGVKTHGEVVVQKKDEPKDPFNKSLILQDLISTAGGTAYEKAYFRPYNPAELYQKKGDYSIFDEMRQDDQVSAMLKLKKYMIVGRGWEIVEEEPEVEMDGDEGDEADIEEGKAPEAGNPEDKPKPKKFSDTQQASEQKQFIEWVLNDYLDRPFDETLQEILSALDYGFSMSEKCAEVIEEKQHKGKIAFWTIKTRPPHDMVIDTDEYGNIRKVMQDRTELPMEKFIHFIHNPEFGNHYGESDLNLGVYRAWWSKNHIIKFLNMSLERHGMPIIVASYGPGTTAADRSRLKEMITSLQAKSGLMKPKETEITALEAKSGGSAGYIEAIDMYNTSIARGVLVPDLLGMSGGQAKGGSYALGQEQFEMFYSIIGVDRARLEKAINRDIIKPLIAWNFGNAEESTIRFQLKPITQDHKAEDAKTWISAVQGGAIKMPNDEEINHLRSILGFPEGEVMQPVVPDPLKPFVPGEDKKPGDNPFAPKDEKKPAEQKPEEDKPVAPAPAKMADLSPVRELTQWEKPVNFVEIKQGMDERERQMMMDAAKVVRMAVSDLVDTIVSKKILENKRLDLATNPDIKYKNMFKQTIKGHLQDSFKYGKAEARKELGKASNNADDFAGLTPGQAKDLLDEVSTYVAHTEWEQIGKVTTPILQDAISTGKSLRDVMKSMDEALAGYDLAFGGARLETMARVNLMKVFNEGRKQLFLEYPDDIQGFQYSAVIDDRTTDLCAELDSLAFPKEEINKWNPPNHFNCRSVLVSIPAGVDVEFDQMPAVREVPGGFLELL